jgi:hypothetical protein
MGDATRKRGDLAIMMRNEGVPAGFDCRHGKHPQIQKSVF